jgi:WD40 repeat protein
MIRGRRSSDDAVDERDNHDDLMVMTRRGDGVGSSADKRVKVWDLAAKECIYTLERPNSYVWSLDFHPRDGSLLALGSDDGSVSVLNISQHIV